MPTQKQKRLAKIALDNPILLTEDGHKRELVVKGGYGPSIQKTPAKVLESQGFKEALAEYGLTEELITTALVEDIKAKPKRRLGELRLGAEILKLNNSEDEKKYPPMHPVVIVFNANDPLSKQLNNLSVQLDSGLPSVESLAESLEVQGSGMASEMLEDNPRN